MKNKRKLLIAAAIIASFTLGVAAHSVTEPIRRTVVAVHEEPEGVMLHFADGTSYYLDRTDTTLWSFGP